MSNAKLTAKIVREIRHKAKIEGFKQARLAREYQVSITTIHNIVAGLTWHNVEMPETEEEIRAQADASLARLMAKLEVDDRTDEQKRSDELVKKYFNPRA